jgi:hypothetical protein
MAVIAGHLASRLSRRYAGRRKGDCEQHNCTDQDDQRCNSLSRYRSNCISWRSPCDLQMFPCKACSVHPARITCSQDVTSNDLSMGAIDAWHVVPGLTPLTPVMIYNTVTLHLLCSINHCYITIAKTIKRSTGCIRVPDGVRQPNSPLSSGAGSQWKCRHRPHSRTEAAPRLRFRRVILESLCRPSRLSSRPV